jgi:phage shock protein A
MISELKNLVAQDKLREAISMLKSLTSYLDEIETSISTKQDITTVNEEISVNSLDESKVDRIKVKIERLEEQLKQLEDQIEEDFAKRWLESANLLLENAKSYVDDSPDEALKTIMKIEQVIERIKNTIQ